MATNGYKKDEISGEEIEVEDGKCVVDGVDTWVVRHISDMRFNKAWKAIQFFVTWDEVGDTSWEPLTSFSEGLDHLSIQAYKLENPEKFEALLQEEREAREAEPKDEEAEEDELDGVDGEDDGEEED